MIVALHGFTGSAKSYSDWPFICPAISGHDSSRSVQKIGSFADEVAHLASGLPESLSVLLGYSMGARLALAIGLRVPHKIERMILVGLHPGLDDEEARQKRREVEGRWVAHLGDSIEDFVDYWESLPIWRSQSHYASPDALQKQRQIRLSHSPGELAGSIERLGLGNMPSYWQRIPNLEVPTLLVAGEEDPKFSAIAQDASARNPEFLSLRVVPKCGHNPFVDCPQDLLSVLQSFTGGAVW